MGAVPRLEILFVTTHAFGPLFRRWAPLMGVLGGLGLVLYLPALQMRGEQTSWDNKTTAFVVRISKQPVSVFPEAFSLADDGARRVLGSTEHCRMTASGSLTLLAYYPDRSALFQYEDAAAGASQCGKFFFKSDPSANTVGFVTNDDVDLLARCTDLAERNRRELKLISR